MVWRLVAGSGPVGLRCSALFQSPGALRSPRSWNSLRGRSPCPLPVSDLEGGKRTLESENPKGCCTTGGRGGSQQVQPLNHRGYMCGPHELRGGGGVPGSPQSFQRQNMVGLRRWFFVMCLQAGQRWSNSSHRTTRWRETRDKHHHIYNRPHARVVL